MLHLVFLLFKNFCGYKIQIRRERNCFFVKSTLKDKVKYSFEMYK